MDPKTKQLVDEAEARAAKATPGPWIINSKQEFTGCDIRGSIQSATREVLLRSPGSSDADFVFAAHARTDVPVLCLAVKEQDKRARHAEEERDLFSKRIDELETERDGLTREAEAKAVMIANLVAQCENIELEHTVSWFDFEKEALEAIGGEVIGMTVNPGEDIPGMIKKLHKHYENRLRVMDERRVEADNRRIKAEEQRDSYKRIASIRPKK